MLFNKGKKDLKISNKTKKKLIENDRKVDRENQKFTDQVKNKNKIRIRSGKIARISRKINYRQKKGLAVDMSLYKKVGKNANYEKR